MKVKKNDKPQNGFLYDGSPTQMDAPILFVSAREKEKPILKSIEIEDIHFTSPHSMDFSHTSKMSTELQNLAMDDDLDGLLAKLEGKALLSYSKAIVIITFQVKKHQVELETQNENFFLNFVVSVLKH